MPRLRLSIKKECICPLYNARKLDCLRVRRSEIVVQGSHRPSHVLSQQPQNVYLDPLVDFRIRAKVSPGYLICIVGSSDELGSWDPLKAVIMERSPIMDTEWHKEIVLTRQKQHLYRFFICRPLLDVQNYVDALLSYQPGIIIHKWESHIEPRIVNASDIIAYGILPIAEFGWIGDQHSVVMNDWLVNLTECRLCLSGEQPVNIYGRDFKSQSLGIKCCPLDCGNAIAEANRNFSKPEPTAAEEVALNRFLLVSSVSVGDYKKMIGPGGVAEVVKCQQQNHFVADMNAVRFSNTTSYELVPQDNQVVEFHNGQSLYFHICTNTPQTLGFRFEFYCEPLGQPKLFGTAFLLPMEKGLSFKTMRMPIFGIDTSPIGYMSLNCLIVRPIPGCKVDMKISYQNHWKHRRNIGIVWDTPITFHTPKILSLIENTLASLKAAQLHDVQFIEFSVQLCKDKVPVIYHDFRILASAYNSQCESTEIYSVLLKDLTLEQLQSARLKGYSKAVARLPPEATKMFDFHPFPTLCAALSCVKPSVGFIIVVKYPQCLDNGKMEVENYFDHNIVVDAVVSTVRNSVASRKIVFTSSDVNTCILLQRKQTKYPVVYRCQATSSEQAIYQDIRTKSSDAAIHFAVLEKLIGVSLQVDEILRDVRIVRKCHSAGLVIFAWSDKDVMLDPEVTQTDAAVTNFIRFYLDYGMKREVFHFSNKKEGIDLTNAYVVMGIQKHIHCCVGKQVQPCNLAACEKL